MNDESRVSKAVLTLMSLLLALGCFSATGLAFAADRLTAGSAPMRTAVSTDLADFLTDVNIEAPTNEDGNYVVNPNGSYEIELFFAENERLQFDDEQTLTYDFPGGIQARDHGPTMFPITITDQDGTAVIENNRFEIVGGRLEVRFNQDDPNFGRFKAVPNAKFKIDISSRFDQSFGEIVFNAIVVKDFVYEEKSDLSISKTVNYDADDDTARYELRISSNGPNENVIVEDRLTGTALAFNRDVVVESSVNGTLSVTPDYAAVANGFRVTIPEMADGETLTLRYSAAVDNTKITGNGTVGQTNNTARVTSTQVPGGKEASAHFAGRAKFHKITKTAAGEPVETGAGRYTQTWTLLVNQDHKIPMGGTYIYDRIRTNSRPFMLFSGDGITVKATREDGSAETRTVPWSDLKLKTNSNGTYGWGYLVPESDGKASYEITYTTAIDTEEALGDLTLLNEAQLYDSYDEGKVTFTQGGESVFNIRKDAVATTATESEWEITVALPAGGLPDLRVVDDAPKLTYGGQDYIDYFIEDSFEVEGLLEKESWNLSVAEGNQRSFTLTFYKSETQSDADKGVLPTPNGQARNILIRFKTAVNQEWLSLAAADGYESSTLSRHRNYACAWSGSYRTPTVDARVTPIKPNLVKNLVERSEAEVDGTTYPVFRYSLGLYGPVEDGIVIRDSFNVDYLRLHDAAGVRISGGSIGKPTNDNGTASATSAPDGMDITVDSFPRQSDGTFHSYYEISYALIVKDRDALAALNREAAATQAGVDLENTATWDGLESSSAANYTYFPYVDKELLSRPTAENGYVAEFKVAINKYAEDLDPASDTLTIRDELSPNLRFVPDSLTIEPADDSISVRHDGETNVLTLEGVPDGTAFTLTYKARVLGNGNVTYSNTIKFGNFEMTVEENVVVESSGAGTGSNPSITLVKRDSETISNTLAGATFELSYVEGEDLMPVQDGSGENVTFTTGADGKALIVGDLQRLGWTLWADRTYRITETAAPPGYEIREEPLFFVLSENPSSQLEFDVTGDQLNFYDDPTPAPQDDPEQPDDPEDPEIPEDDLDDPDDPGKTPQDENPAQPPRDPSAPPTASDPENPSDDTAKPANKANDAKAAKSSAPTPKSSLPTTRDVLWTIAVGLISIAFGSLAIALRAARKRGRDRVL